MRPWYVEIFGAPISMGQYATVIAAPDKRVRFTVWGSSDRRKGISIGNYSLISPGVRLSAAESIQIGHNCMLANGVYITDCDWHGIYDRAATGDARPVTLHNNVWVGDSAIICKGVTIGENSIVGAGSVVVKPLPANVIAAGNPATVVRRLNPQHPCTTRGDWFSQHPALAREMALWDRATLQSNSLLKWLRSLIFPRPGD